MQLANQPDKLIKKLLLNIAEKGQFMNKETNQVSDVSSTVLSRFLYIIGHVAIRQLVYLDVSVYKELKRRNMLREMQGKKKKQMPKNTSNSKNKSSISSNVSILSNASTSSNARRMGRIRDNSVLTEDNGEEALEGAMDDTEAEFLNDALEHEIVTGNGLLVKFMYVFEY